MADISKIQLENAVYDIKDASARTEIEKLNYNYTIMIGDSYASVKGGVTGWPTRLQTKLGLTNNQCLKLDVSGGGFLAGTPFLTALQNNIDNIPDKNKVSKIIVVGGDNDRIYTPSQIRTAILAFTSYCNNQFPNAHIYIGMFGYCTSSNTRRKDIYFNSLPGYAFFDAQVQNTSYMNFIEFSVTEKNYFQDDTVHLNDAGQNKLVRAIYNCLISGATNNVSQESPVTITPKSNGTVQSGSINVSTCYDTITVLIREIILNYSTTNISFNTSARQSLGNWENNFLYPNEVSNCIIPCLVTVYSTGGTYTELDFLRFDYDGELNLIRPNNTAINNITSIRIANCSQVFNRRYC